MSEVLRTLIVDSDPESCKSLLDFVSTDPENRMVEICLSGFEAVIAIRDFKPDVLICEVEIEGIDGFTLLESVPFKSRPATIFISTHNHFGERAFELSAADYIVKPFRKERFLQAFERARNQARHPFYSGLAQTAERVSRTLAIKSGRSVIFVKPEELSWAEAEGKHVRLHMDYDVVVVKMSISALEKQLDSVQFVRIHRCTIVNVDRVRRIQPWNHRRTYEVTLDDGTTLVLSRRTKLGAIRSRIISHFQHGASFL